MKAIEEVPKVRAAAVKLKAAFAKDAKVAGALYGEEVYWHERLGIWGSFGKTPGRTGVERDWNAFGQKLTAFRHNMVVQINQPNQGIDKNIQGVFAHDGTAGRWLMHQGRMSVPGNRVTEADFIAATKLKPDTVAFSDGTIGHYHKVALIDAHEDSVQDSIAAFVAKCAQARLAKTVGHQPVEELQRVLAWERGLSPEVNGTFQIAARDPVSAYRTHADIWQSLADDLKKRNTPISNDRVGQYGPDLFTHGDGPKVLFEIKSHPGAQDIFTAVGQLHVYDRLLGGQYRKVLVVPQGMGKDLLAPISDLKIDVVEFRRDGRKVVFDAAALSRCLKP